ncbi:hypothetical protein SASPL_118988 [Salvia splendens]|uniref:SBP-type domain-containing protein n=1 Tax=Salvia splendens TaxID=180675 RepID=A0A8X8ZXR6_SALSN|nr:squamosa promoter-binding-like protein 12 [Salvia splendens]XP_042062580.1 squamosa promoter-binding-like protein 12 [Salvia splendens]XP_042062581.1 squamosa promoter-binding-like protein 12 [Salvia splendens]XP_042062582.1 squamosa promoter-binding-like protein 12 [Salvia splendens]XP_042062583.1 squamosa promoter-binding-like protein 12 [Salvia splendens]XP_042062584.1 squamosa promoter-binding-like protein 12 [Salvia splendens]XP_042062585.1 squamosa promoter-binding-like protein 12 [S
MSHCLEMDWNTKWDWESYDALGSKKLQLVDWTVIDDREIDAGSFNLLAGCGNSGASGLDGGRVSSAKSSISVSDSSAKSLMANEDFSGNFKVTESEGTPEASIGSVEPLIGLKLGKRTYFENSGAGSHAKSASGASLKKPKSVGGNLPTPRCVVEGCNVDLSTAKDYHRKHRVCSIHSKAPKVVIGGLERRFCQQCSRFHSPSEFDEKKRSCRRRLSDHNARRRKPQQDVIQYTTRLPSPFYGGRQQMSFVLSNCPPVQLTKEYHPSKSSGDGASSEKMHIPGAKHPHFINTAAKGFPASKSSVADVSNPGSKVSPYSSHLDAVPEYPRALSLLSNNSWRPESMALNPIQENEAHPTQPMMHGIPEGTPLSSSSSSEFWLHPPSAHQPWPADANFQLFVTPCEETDLYSNIMN